MNKARSVPGAPPISPPGAPSEPQPTQHAEEEKDTDEAAHLAGGPEPPSGKLRYCVGDEAVAEGSANSDSYLDTCDSANARLTRVLVASCSEIAGLRRVRSAPTRTSALSR